MARRGFFEDTKANGGWFKMAKQQGEDGSKKSLTLSLLVDHALLLDYLVFQ